MAAAKPSENDILELVVKSEFLGQPVLQVHHLRAGLVEGAGVTIPEVLDQWDTLFVAALQALMVSDAIINEITCQIILPAGTAPPPPVPRGLLFNKTINEPGGNTEQSLPGQAALYISEKGSAGLGTALRGGQFIGGLGEGSQDDGRFTDAFIDDAEIYANIFLSSFIVGTPGVDSQPMDPCIFSQTRWEAGNPVDVYAPSIDVVSVDPLVTTQDRRKRGTATGGFNP